MKILFKNLVKPYSAVLFLNNTAAGIFLIALTFINPSVAISGIIAVLFTVLFTKLIELDPSYLSQGFYIYNSLLVGMGIGYIFSPSWESILLIAVSSTFAFLFSFMMNRLFSAYKIPILSLPFSIVTIFVYMASLKYSGLLSSLVNNAVIYDISLPLEISCYLKSLGTILFLPNNIAGILIVLMLLSFSRIIVFMSLVGFYFGVFVNSLLIGSFAQALCDPYSFNYILVAVTLCGIFLLPTIRNFLLSLIAVAISVLLVNAIAILFNYYAIPVFTLPFNITVIVFIFILSNIYYKEFNYNIKETPEKSLSAYLSSIFRFGTAEIKIALPFSGKWMVYQAFDDVWTHKGNYKYAYDFVKHKKQKSYEKEGLYLQDYYAFGESILAPVSGYIVDCRDDLVDNIIGEVDTINNWGNYLIIKSDLGFYVEISHLMQYSLSKNIGAYVNLNEPIAKCGNSGYSPEPHIHIQVQSIGLINAFTQAFSFKEYYQENQLIFNSLPNKGDYLSSAIADRGVSSRLLFILDDCFTYEVHKENQVIDLIDFNVKMDEYGAFYFEDKEKNQLYFAQDSSYFYFYNYIGGESHLKYLFVLMPRIPFINKEGIYYNDYLPINLIYSPLKVAFLELLSSLNTNFSKVQEQYHFEENSIVSIRGGVQLEPLKKGFSQIDYNNIILKRIS